MLNTLENSRYMCVCVCVYIYICVCVCVCEFKRSYVLRTLFFQFVQHHLSIGGAKLRKMCRYIAPNHISSVNLGMRNKLNFGFGLERGIVLLK